MSKQFTSTARQDDSFLKEVIPNGILEDAIRWINENLHPLDVFDRNTLIGWAEDEGTSEVFSEKELSAWAEDNGYIKKEE